MCCINVNAGTDASESRSIAASEPETCGYVSTLRNVSH